ncbi:hypothetical protein DVH24_030903 [Malus domestica]|uniref:Uncharacterized protein n=1 Tax=Malus domestica TaxID=3750 RepID=A0A498HCU0_MALDO|nr:hypothetical protein DVH24_030903 [Malus domestica]
MLNEIFTLLQSSLFGLVSVVTSLIIIRLFINVGGSFSLKDMFAAGTDTYTIIDWAIVQGDSSLTSSSSITNAKKVNPRCENPLLRH